MSIMQDSREATMVGRRTDGSTVKRPLSPHLQVYDMLQLTSALSISSRITGAAWGVGLALLVWWLAAAASWPSAFAGVQWFMSSWFGLLILFGMTGAAWYHTLNGVGRGACVAGLVAGGRGVWPLGLRGGAVVHVLLARAAHPLRHDRRRLVPHAERRAAPRLGRGLRLRHPFHLPHGPLGPGRHRR